METTGDLAADADGLRLGRWGGGTGGVGLCEAGPLGSACSQVSDPPTPPPLYVASVAVLR